jgi:hypothetical protein
MIGVYAFLYFQNSFSNIEEKTHEIVYSEDIIVAFSSLKPSYMPGETATFYIDILNRREFSISNINFSLSVRALSLYGVKIFSIEGRSERTFAPGKFVRMQTYPKNAVEVALPELIFPGFYALELSTEPSILRAPPKASITIYVGPSALFMPYLGIVSSISGFVYVLLFIGARVDIGRLPKSTAIRRLLLCAYLAEIKSQEITSALRKILINFSIGNKFILLGICSLIVAFLPLTLDLEEAANDLAILSYFSLTMGVVNIIWEAISKTVNLKHGLSMREVLSLIVLAILISFSNMFLAIGTIAFTIGMIMMRLRIIAHANGQISTRHK